MPRCLFSFPGSFLRLLTLEKVLKIDRPDGRKVLRFDEADAPRVKAAASRQLVSRFATPRPLGRKVLKIDGASPRGFSGLTGLRPEG